MPPLNAAGLQFPPQNGSFQVLVQNQQTGQTQTTTVNVALTGLGTDTTLNDIDSQLNAISGITASINANGQLTIASSGAGQQFSFANDTSGALASLGLNTFFTGSNADNLAVNQDVIDDPSKFAASQGGIAADTNNAVQLANFGSQPLTSQNGQSISDVYTQITSDVAEASNNATAMASGDATFANTLNGQALATSGVSIDDEVIKMMGYEQAYEASAKYITTLDNLFQVLTNL